VPAAFAVDRLVGRAPALDDRGGVRTKLCQVLRVERGRRADDVAAKSDRRCPVQCQQVRVDRISDVDPPEQELVGLYIGIGIAVAHRLAVILLGEKA